MGGQPCVSYSLRPSSSEVFLTGQQSSLNFSLLCEKWEDTPALLY